jgi:Tol biopolymer transport system component
MKAAAALLALVPLLTVEQRDSYRSSYDPPSSAVSADGRFVAFTTYSQLVAADADHSSDVYVLDRARQQVTFESPDTVDYPGDSMHPGISGDGRFVIFARANAVVLHDRAEDVTTILGEGHQPFIAENGRVAFFAAAGVDRAAGVDVNGQNWDIYSVDLVSGQAQRVSVGMPGLDALTASSVEPSSSSDGRYVAFASRRQPHGGRGESPFIFVRDTALYVTRLVGSGWNPSLSGDGRFVTFVGYSHRVPHIFVADLNTGVSRVITNSVRRGFANGPSARPVMSSNGRFVAFQSEASDLVAVEDFNLLWDVFVLDRTSNAISRLSGDRDEAWMEPSSGPSIDATGSVVAFSSRHPTDASDKRNDFDLYVATIHATTLASAPSRPLLSFHFLLSVSPEYDKEKGRRPFRTVAPPSTTYHLLATSYRLPARRCT